MDFLTSESVVNNLEFIFRIFVAGICTALIGYERENRGKGAGIKTHIIVGITSALIMIISKYAFLDVSNEFIKADASRIASNIIPGIGFIGAGVIFVQRKKISGLTTAAGILVTSAIGMSLGAGMYFIGIVTTIVVMLIQLILHKDIGFLQAAHEDQIVVVVKNTEEAQKYILNELKKHEIIIDNIGFDKIDDEYTELTIDVYMPKGFNNEIFVELMNNEFIKTLKI